MPADLEAVLACERFLRRIACDPHVMGGRPVVRGTRITVRSLLDALEADATRDELLEAHPELEREDIDAAVLYGKVRVHKLE